MKHAPTSLRAPTLGESLIPVVCLVVFLAGSVLNLNDLPELAVITPLLRALASIPYFGDVLHASIPVQLPLVAATVVASIMAKRVGLRWRDIHESYLRGIKLSLGAVLILLVVGMLIGVWIASGVVPLMIVWGLKLLSPGAFLFVTCLICAIVSVVTGSSWTTAGTVGVALIGVGQGLGVPMPMVAGAIISGAYFGDKMSPLSDTTNLAPGVAGAELFEHVKHMLFTTGPSLVIALGLYWLLGLRFGEGTIEAGSIDEMIRGMSAGYTLSGWLVVPPLVVLVLVIARVPALPSLVAGVVVGGVMASVLQGSTLSDLLITSYDGFVSETGVAAVDDLLTRGGMSSMYGTVGIILCAMCYGGVMERSGMLERIAGAILGLAKSRGGLVGATLATSMGINLVASDQYLSIVVPGRMYRGAYAKRGLHPKNLSRCLEDGGTITSPLIPWNSCGAYMFATLGVFPLAYLPFAFLNLLNPLISLLYGFTGWTMAPADPVDDEEEE
ncbi:Na+/H+ antiporter NhaC [Actomonas aquatica]|uniref:Na+/H+ antiporter NhaC n=1 Tax=Actomonas aquatica TaxID=2866162 RepID=A0ABZ1C6Q6_9BACT|nr:Na+/H+ antiporter NhaC [Opitutus sp. WL0086]WRQ87201.1 Na+/H+ antiporter NhaC [Opitutus sp. WL0086]